MKKGGNPQKFIEHDIELADTPISVKLPTDIDSFVRSLPDRTKWLRSAIAKAYLEELENQASN